VPADNNHGAIQVDIRTFIEGHESYRHGETSPTEAFDPDTIA
jgi:hypothetical protein